jgi:hypothetical protein
MTSPLLGALAAALAVAFLLIAVRAIRKGGRP